MYNSMKKDSYVLSFYIIFLEKRCAIMKKVPLPCFDGFVKIKSLLDLFIKAIFFIGTVEKIPGYTEKRVFENHFFTSYVSTCTHFFCPLQV